LFTVSADSTLFAEPEPPTVPGVEWPVVRPAALDRAARRRRYPIPPLELSSTGRHGVALGDAAIPVEMLLSVEINAGDYVGKAVHARRKEWQNAGNSVGKTLDSE
jgi:hypothetical protein